MKSTIYSHKHTVLFAMSRKHILLLYLQVFLRMCEFAVPPHAPAAPLVRPAAPLRLRQDAELRLGCCCCCLSDYRDTRAASP